MKTSKCLNLPHMLTLRHDTCHMAIDISDINDQLKTSNRREAPQTQVYIYQNRTKKNVPSSQDNLNRRTQKKTLF